jgi:hypothetical protein
LAVSSSHAGDWLNALPSQPLGLKLSDNEIRIAAGLRLGARVTGTHTCRCGQLVDELGHHPLSCRKAVGRFSRHTDANNILQKALNTAHIPATLEPLGLIRDDGKRPDGCTIAPWSKGQLLVWDFTSPDTLAPSYQSSATIGAGRVATEKEELKRLKYRSLPSGHLFVPIAIETLGPVGKSAYALIKEIGRRVSSATGDIKATAHLFQRMSVAIQRGNAACILGAGPGGPLLPDHLV